MPEKEKYYLWLASNKGDWWIGMGWYDNWAYASHWLEHFADQGRKAIYTLYPNTPGRPPSQAVGMPPYPVRRT